VRSAAERLTGDEATGAMMVWTALGEPLRWIANNAGLPGGVKVQEVEAADGSMGLDAETGELVDLVKVGVVDPAKVTRSALQNAASVAAMLLTTEVLISEKPVKKHAPALPAGHLPRSGMDGGMGGMGAMGGF
jgi:chaperonin GroEL